MKCPFSFFLKIFKSIGKPNSLSLYNPFLVLQTRELDIDKTILMLNNCNMLTFLLLIKKNTREQAWRKQLRGLENKV